MNRVLCIIPLGFLACVFLLCGGLYFYFVGGVCIFLIFIILIELCCTKLHTGECYRWRRSFPSPLIRSWLDKGKTWCSLCRAMVKNEAWDEHRTTCASEHAQELEQMGNYYNLGPKCFDYSRGPKWGPKICPKCEKLMKVWPEAPLWNEFQCANNRMCRQSEGGAVENRCEPPRIKFCCFQCDINYCGACVRDETTTTNNPQPSEAQETIVDITTEDLDPIPLVPTVDDQESHFHNISNQVDDLPRSDIPRTQNPGSIPWVPSAPPDDTKSDNDNMNLPSYQESIAP